MKKIISALLFAVILISLFSACSGDTRMVKFYVGVALYDIIETKAGEPVSMPGVPPEKKNHIFVGWSTKEYSMADEYDFSKPVHFDSKLYALFVPDAVKVTNMLLEEQINAVITIKNKSYTNSSTYGESSFNLQGSGVVIEIKDGYAYALTNYHVAKKTEGYDHQKIEVEDSLGRLYDAEIYNFAIDAEYDLALVRFKYNSQNELVKVDLEEKNPRAHDFVASMGTPDGQKNTLTLGEIVEYKAIDKNKNPNLGDVKFEVIVHNSPIKEGSSGGPLFNLEGRLIGINFAGNEEQGYGCAIPIEKVREFLDKYYH